MGARRHYVHFALALVSLVIGCILLSLLLLLTVHNKWVWLLLPLAVLGLFGNTRKDRGDQYAQPRYVLNIRRSLVDVL